MNAEPTNSFFLFKRPIGATFVTIQIIHELFHDGCNRFSYVLAMLVWLITVSKRGHVEQTSVWRKWWPDRNYLCKFHKYDQREISVCKRLDVCGIGVRNLRSVMIHMLSQAPIHEWILQVRLSPSTQIMILSLYSLRRRRLFNIGIPIINLRLESLYP